MIYNEKYYIDFTSAPDDAGVSTNYRVSLRQRAEVASTATPTRLEGGPSPFILSLGNEDDPLVVQRTASAQISFFDDVALSALLPADASEWQVTLTRTSDNKQIFIGYLTAEVYTQPAIEGPNVVTVNAASPMVPIMAETMPLANKGKLTVGELLHMALTTCDGITQVYMPAMYALDLPVKASQYTDILRMMISPSLYTSVNEMASVTGEEYEYDTYDMPLEALCKLFGWSMVDPGDGSLYFLSPGYEGDYMQLSLADLKLASVFLPKLVAPQFFAEGAIQPIDTGDTVEVRQGAGSTTITVSATDVKVITPNIEDYIQSQGFTRRNAAYSYYGVPDAEVEIAELNTVVRHPDITLHKYILNGSLAADGSIVKEWAETTDPLTSSLAGAAFQKFQWANPDDLSLGAEKRIRSWSLQPAYRIQESASATVPGVASGGDITAVIPEDLPLLTMRAGIGSFTGGALVINMNALAVANDGLFIPEDRYVQGGSLTEATAYNDAPFGLQYFWGNNTVLESIKGVKCSLSVGNMYWTGARWSATPSKFLVSLSKERGEWHPVVSNKNVDMLYEDAEGMYVPINIPLSGPIVLKIFRTTVVTSAGEDNGFSGPWYMKDLTVTYKPTIVHEIPSVADTTYYRDFGLRFTEEKGVELPLHSRINGSEQMSLIYQNEATSLDTLYRSTHAAQAKPEEFLLDEYQRIYGRALQRWRRGMMMRDLRPIDLYSRVGSTDSALMLTGYTADFDANTVAVYLSDVKTITPVHYVDEN